MKKLTIKFLGLLALVLSLGIVVNSTLAYFTATDEAMGSGVIHAGEKTKIQETVENNNKTIVIENTGNTPVMVKVNVYAAEKYISKVELGSGWSKGNDGAYSYSEVLAPGASTTSIFVEVTFPEGDKDNHEIIVTSKSSGVAYDKDNNPYAIEWEVK